MKPHTSTLRAALLILLSSGGLIGKDIGDDFSRDSGLWMFSRTGGGKGKHTLNNGRLEFSTQGMSSNNDSATRYWKTPIGAYNKSWSVQADVFLGNFALGNPNPYAGLALLVGRRAGHSHSFIRIQLCRGDRGYAFNADGYADRQHLGSQWADTASNTATLCIQYDAAAKVLIAKYDADGPGAADPFVDLFKVDIANGPDNWKMTSKDAFDFSIVSQSTRTVISPGDMCFDNVLVHGTDVNTP